MKLHLLHKLLQKSVKWIWGPDQQFCLEKTTKIILSAKVPMHYDTNKLRVLHTDASHDGLGAIMSHIMDDGSEYPVGFFSRTLKVAETNITPS